MNRIIGVQRRYKETPKEFTECVDDYEPKCLREKLIEEQNAMTGNVFELLGWHGNVSSIRTSHRKTQQTGEMYFMDYTKILRKLIPKRKVSISLFDISVYFGIFWREDARHATYRRAYDVADNTTVRIFKYDIPKYIEAPQLFPNAQIVKDMYYTEVLLPRLIESTSAYTNDPQQADFFLIPHQATANYHHCVLNLNQTTSYCKNANNRYLTRLFRFVIEEYVFFNRSAGTDHVIVMAWDQAAEVAQVEGEDSEPDWLRLQLNNVIQLTSLGYVPKHWNFHPHKDIVIPPFINIDKADEWFKENGSITAYPVNKDASAEAKTLLESYNKSILAYFRGAVLEDKRYSFGIRQFIFTTFGQLPTFLVATEHARPDEYFTELHQSLFCLCPAGWSPWSPRLFECVYFNAIPVIISDEIRLPFEDLIDYRSFTVKRLRSQVKDLERDLLHLAADRPRIRSKQEYMRKIRNLLIWREDVLNEPSAINMLLHELSRRRRSKPIGNEHFI